MKTQPHPPKRTSRWLTPLVSAGLALTLSTGAALAQYGQNQGGYGAQETQYDPADDGLPMTFAGKGCRVIVNTLDPTTLAMTGTVEFSGAKLPWQGRYPQDAEAQSMTVTVQTPDGPRPMKLTDETETVARVEFGGQTYKVEIDGRYEPADQVEAAENEAEADEAAEQPKQNKEDKENVGEYSFGVGVVPHEAMPGWLVKELRPGSDAADALRLGDVILSAEDVAAEKRVMPSDGFEAFKSVVGSTHFKLQVMRQSENPPVFTVTMQRAATPAKQTQQDETIQRASAGDWGQMTLTKVTMQDPGMSNMDSHTMLVPKGWTFQGQAFWAGPEGFRVLPSPMFSAEAADGTSVSLAPSLSFKDIRPTQMGAQFGMQAVSTGQFSNGYPGGAMPQTPQEWQQWLTHLIQQGNPEYRNVRVELPQPEPELSRTLQQQIAPLKPMYDELNGQSQQLNQSGGLQMSFFLSADAFGFDVTFERNGQPMEGAVLLGVTFFGNQSQLGVDATWALQPMMAFTAPRGKLRERMPMLMAVATSLRPTEPWQQMLTDHIAKMNKIDRDHAAKMADINANHAREMARISREGHQQRMADMDSNMESWQRRQDVEGEGQRKFINALTGVEEYTTPGSDTSVTLPIGYDRVYTNGAGDYLLTNNALYDPATDPGVNGQTWNPMQSRDR